MHLVRSSEIKVAHYNPFLFSSHLSTLPFTHWLCVQILVGVGVAGEGSGVLHDISHVSPSCGKESEQLIYNTILLGQGPCMQHCISQLSQAQLARKC